jgi:lipoprotein NlpD
VIVFALGAGTLVARFFGSTDVLPSGYTTPAASSGPATKTAPSPTHPASGPATAAAPDAVQAASPIEPEQSAVAPASSPELATAIAETVSAPTASSSEQPTAPPEQPTGSPHVGYIEYTVQKGDTLKIIADNHGVTIRDILAINQIPNPDSLSVGTVIRVPKT